MTRPETLKVVCLYASNISSYSMADKITLFYKLSHLFCNQPTHPFATVA